jgi:hypothetical protein
MCSLIPGGATTPHYLARNPHSQLSHYCSMIIHVYSSSVHTKIYFVTDGSLKCVVKISSSHVQLSTYVCIKYVHMALYTTPCFRSQYEMFSDVDCSSGANRTSFLKQYSNASHCSVRGTRVELRPWHRIFLMNFSVVFLNQCLQLDH